MYPGIVQQQFNWRLEILFYGGEQGVWYDPSDLSTLFQDSVGSDPVTADGDPVGLMLDKHLGLELGPELIQNGAFDSDLSGWSPAAANISLVSGEMHLQSGGASGGAHQTITTTPGSTYQISAYVRLGSALNIAIRVDDGASPGTGGLFSYQLDSGAQTVKAIFKAAGTSTTIFFRQAANVAGMDSFVDNVSVRELPGNHATQDTTAAKPTYRTDGTLHRLKPDGDDDHLVIGDALNHEEFTACVAVRLDGSGDGRVIDNRGTGAAGTKTGWLIKSENGIDDLAFIDDGNGHYWSWNDGGSGQAGDIRIMTLRYSPNSGLFRVNGVPITPKNTSSQMGDIVPTTSGVLFTASGSPGVQSFGGDFFGGLVVSRALSDYEISELEKYLAAKAGVTLP